MAMPEVLQQMEQSDVTVHGFRSTFRDWAAEATAYRNHVVEGRMKRSKKTAAKNSLLPTIIARTNETCHPKRTSPRRMGAATMGGRHTKISATNSQLPD